MSSLFQRQCPLCKKDISCFAKKCPNCGFVKPSGAKSAAFFFIITLIFLSFVYYPSLNINTQMIGTLKNKQQKTPISFEEIELRPTSVLSGLSKEQILKQRTQYVKESVVFKDLKDYKPSEDVYQIEDYLPWIGAEQMAKYGANNNKNIGKGDSRHSISINNPELLVSFIVPNFGDQKDIAPYSKEDLLQPVKLSYDKNNKIIKAEFNLKSFFDKNPNYYGGAMYVDETNARDLGYHWFYCPKKENLGFINPQTSIYSHPYKVQGYYHKGSSCGLEGGCNNYSPYQPNLVFMIKDMPSSMTIYMYKEKPKSLRQKPDMTYIMVF